jgi:hypothetical protein
MDSPLPSAEGTRIQTNPRPAWCLQRAGRRSGGVRAPCPPAQVSQAPGVPSKSFPTCDLAWSEFAWPQGKILKQRHGPAQPPPLCHTSPQPLLTPHTGWPPHRQGPQALSATGLWDWHACRDRHTRSVGTGPSCHHSGATWVGQAVPVGSPF